MLTCNLHQGWPKFAQNLWMASADRGLAALVYAPSRVTAKIADGTEVTIIEETDYPFRETVGFTFDTPRDVEFPLHLRIPGWCTKASLSVNARPTEAPLKPGTIHVLRRVWRAGDKVELRLPMTVRSSTWFDSSVAIERGPLVFALRIEEEWKEIKGEYPDAPANEAMHRGHLECRPTSPWNYALLEEATKRPAAHFRVEVSDTIRANPWTISSAPVTLHGEGVRLPYWKLSRNSATPPPLSPARSRVGVDSTYPVRRDHIADRRVSVGQGIAVAVETTAVPAGFTPSFYVDRATVPSPGGTFSQQPRQDRRWRKAKNGS